MGRFEEVQDILRSGRWKSSNSNSSLDALLLILGIDGRFNEGCNKMFQWLCGGHNPLQEKLEEGQDGDEDNIEDVVVLISKNSVHLYCNPCNMKLLLPYFAKVSQLCLHSLSSEFSQNVDFAEEYKMKEFIKLTSPHSVIGIPYSTAYDASNPKFDPMILEKTWPLIQSHAAETLGRHGFFTLAHEVVEVSHFLEEVYDTLDPPSLKGLVCQSQLPGFLKQWEFLYAMLDSSSPDGIAALTQDQLSESFRLYMTHQQSQRTTFYSFHVGVWVGRNTPDMDSKPQEIITVGTAGLEHNSSIHIVCSLADPKGCLIAQRTYFLWQMDPLGPANSDVRLLQQLYLCLVTAVYAGIRSFVKTQSYSEACRVVMNALKQQCTDRELSLSSDYWEARENLQTSLAASSLCGSQLRRRRCMCRTGLKSVVVWCGNGSVRGMHTSSLQGI